VIPVAAPIPRKPRRLSRAIILFLLSPHVHEPDVI